MNIESGQFNLETFDRRREYLAAALRQKAPNFDTALIVGRVPMYWLCGTLQDGIVVLRNDGSLILWVRRSYERARYESPLPDIRPMRSYRDLLAAYPQNLGTTFVDAESLNLATLGRLKRHFSFSDITPLDGELAELRAIKDANEQALIREAGKRHALLLNERVPALLHEGISEAELGSAIYSEAVALGHQGLMRLQMFQTEIAVGQIGFGTNSLYPTAFDGPGGMRGLHPAAPVLGSRERRLKRGDLVFVDLGFGYAGYHSDKTQVYSFGKEPPAEAVAIHEACRLVLSRALKTLKPGKRTGEVWAAACADLPPELEKEFMGFGSGKVSFLGHGLGLQIDEPPVIRPKGEELLKAGMVFALEPKSGLAGYGMLGVEETYLITATGAECLTGGDGPLEYIPLA